jgi:hypothetical protein
VVIHDSRPRGGVAATSRGDRRNGIGAFWLMLVLPLLLLMMLCMVCMCVEMDRVRKGLMGLRSSAQRLEQGV